MSRFSCFSSSTAQHRPKEVFSSVDTTMIAVSKEDSQDQTVNPTTGSASPNQTLVDATMLAVSKEDSQDQTVNPTTRSASPNQMADEINCSAVSGHCGTSTSSHQECWRSEDLNRSACSDGSKEVGCMKKSQSLGNILHKDRDHYYSEGTECDVDCDVKSTAAIGETTELCSTKNVYAFDDSSDLISHDHCEPSGDHAMGSDRHHISYSHRKFPRSQSAVFQNNATSDNEGSVDSEILGSHCRSVDGLCSLSEEKVDYLSVMEMHRSKSTLDMCSGPSSDKYQTPNMEENGSIGCSDAADEGQRSSGSAEENFVRDGVLVGHEYWDVKYISGDHSVNPVAPFSADHSRDACHRSVDDFGLSDVMDQEIEEKLWNRDSTLHNQSLAVEVPDSRNMSNTKDSVEEPEHGKTGIDADQNELSPRTYSIKRIEDWINQIDMDDITVNEQGESSSSASAKSREPVAAVPAVRPDGKSPLGMEIAYTYISKLTPVSSSAQLANLGLVAIPRLSAFSGLRLVNLPGNSIVRVTAGALPKGLHMLSLVKNNISTIEGLRELTRLRLLDLSYNRISRIGHGLSSCSSLKELYLAGNKISEVDGLHRLLKLKVLDLRHNKISTSKGLGQLAANYNSLEAINLDGNPAQKNVGDEHLKKYLLGLLPNLVVYNKHPIRATGSKDVSDRHSRKISSSHRSDRGVRSDRKSSRLVGVSSSHKTQSSRHARPGYASGSGSLLKHSSSSSSLLKQSRVRNTPMPLLGSRPAEQASVVDLAKKT